MNPSNPNIAFIPPQNIEAEKSLLGSVLLDKDAMIKIADILSANDFYDDRHQIIFEAMVALYEKQSPLDVITITDILNDRKKLDIVEIGRAHV